MRQRDRMTATVDLSELDSSLPEGVTRLTWMTVAKANAKPTIFASIVLPDGDLRPVDVTIIEEDGGKRRG